MSMHDSIQVGDTYPTKDGDVEILEIQPKGKARIKYLNTGHEANAIRAAILKGTITDASLGKKSMKPGDIFPSNKFGDIEVLELLPKKKVSIKFLNTGNVVTVWRYNVYNGYVADKSTLPVAGDIYTNKKGLKFKIVSYNSATDVDVEFIDSGYKTKTKMQYCKDGSVKDHLTADRKDGGLTTDPSYHNHPAKVKWESMMNRCYNPDYHKNKPSYKEVTVCKEWHDFVNFANWCDDNYIEGYELDKDLLIEGNKVYGPDTCTFVPRWLNLIPEPKIGHGGVIKRGTKYNASRVLNGKRTYTGSYDTFKEANLVYVMNTYSSNYLKIKNTEDFIHPRLKEVLLERYSKYMGMSVQTASEKRKT